MGTLKLSNEEISRVFDHSIRFAALCRVCCVTDQAQESHSSLL